MSNNLFDTTVRDARPGEIKYIDHLRKKEGSALGFIPRTTYESIVYRARVANRDRWKYSRVLVTEDNGELTGFCYFTYFSDWVKIVQIAVQQDARRFYRAMLMTDEVEKHAYSLYKTGITARVATDLESNLFWKAMGYIVQSTDLSTSHGRGVSKGRRKITIYQKEIQLALF